MTQCTVLLEYEHITGSIARSYHRPLWK